MKHRTLPVLTEQNITRFWLSVDKTPGLGPKGECWEWRGNFMTSGYGLFVKGHQTRYAAHRIGFLIQHGRDPESELVCHHCDHKPCVRGSHLFSGSHAANSADMKAKGRSATGDKNGMRTHPERRSPGEKNGYAKLSDAEVREICRAYDAKEADQYELADRFHVWQMTISRIVRRVSRKAAHLQSNENMYASAQV